MPRTGPDALFQVGTAGWAGFSETSDTVNGWGDDQWQIDFPQAVTLTIEVDDCCIVGDNYEVYVDGQLIGTTPQEPLYGPTLSNGTFTVTVQAGTHVITIRDPGGIAYYQQGDTFMIPAGYYVSITVAAAVVNHPIIFVHGIGMDASTIGSRDTYAPLISQLQSVYGQANVYAFAYVDDKSLGEAPGGCPSSLYPPCMSQSSILLNADALATQVGNLYTSSQHKVALIGYSMGGAIIRTMLAGCPEYSGGPRDCPNAPSLVDDAVSINGVQQGSWLMAAKQGLDVAGYFPAPIGPLANGVDWAAYSIAKSAMGLDANYPAEQDLAPRSTNVLAHNSVSPPSGINYDTFFGDIRIGWQASIFIWHVHMPGSLHAGDLVLLPGSDNPQDSPFLGGARFCAGCGNQDQFAYHQTDPTTSYSEWPLRDDVYVDYNVLLNLLPVIGPAMDASSAAQALGDAANAPMQHLNISHDNSLNGTDITVQDNTGRGGSVSIANEIVWQIEKGDGIS